MGKPGARKVADLASSRGSPCQAKSANEHGPADQRHAFASPQSPTLPTLGEESTRTPHETLGEMQRHSAGGRQDRSPVPPASARLANSSAIDDAFTHLCPRFEGTMSVMPQAMSQPQRGTLLINNT